MSSMIPVIQSHPMFDKLAAIEQQYETLMQLLGTTEVQSDSSAYRKHAKTLAEIEPIVQKFREYKGVIEEVARTEELAAGPDADMRDLAHQELKALVAQRDAILAE